MALFKDILIACFLIFVIAWLIRSKKFFSKTNLKPNFLILLFSLKLACAIFSLKLVNGSFNLYSFNGDSIVYLGESDLLAEYAKKEPVNFLKSLFIQQENLENFPLKASDIWSVERPFEISDGRNFIRFNSILQLITFNSRYSILVIYCFIAFSALYYFFLSLKDRLEIKGEKLFLIFFCFPSILFWTSCILKEVPAYFFTSTLFYGMFQAQKVKRLYWISASLLGLLLFKTPFFFLAIPSILFFVINEIHPNKTLQSVLIFTSICFCLISFSGTRNRITELISQEQFDLVNIARGGVFFRSKKNLVYCLSDLSQNGVKVKGDSIKIEKPVWLWKIPKKHSELSMKIRASEDQINTFKIDFSSVKSESLLNIEMIQNDWFKLLRNIPSALTISFVRPLWNDPGSNLKFLAFVENISLLALLVISFFRQSNVNSTEKYILYSIFIFGLTIYLALGLTIPVTGALMRYKIIGSMCFLYFATWKIFKPKQP